jgi:hypothetical protein
MRLGESLEDNLRQVSSSPALVAILRTTPEHPRQGFRYSDQQCHESHIAELLELRMPAIGAAQPGQQFVGAHALPALITGHVFQAGKLHSLPGGLRTSSPAHSATHLL